MEILANIMVEIIWQYIHVSNQHVLTYIMLYVNYISVKIESKFYIFFLHFEEILSSPIILGYFVLWDIKLLLQARFHTCLVKLLCLSLSNHLGD